jgi:hypothetical protein
MIAATGRRRLGTVLNRARKDAPTTRVGKARRDDILTISEDAERSRSRGDGRCGKGGEVKLNLTQ